MVHPTPINKDATVPKLIVVMLGAHLPLFSRAFSRLSLTTPIAIALPQGVSGTGKSTLGAALARATRLPFIDGDDLHPPANVAKMSRGEPLDDVDRQPWLEAIRKAAVTTVLAQSDGDQRATPTPTENSMAPCHGQRRAGVIVACSALKKTYRAVLRGQPPAEGSTRDATPLTAYFVYLKGDREVLMARMRDRQGHFMKAGMLESQLDALESPEGEPGVVTVSVDMTTDAQVQRVVEVLGL